MRYAEEIRGKENNPSSAETETSCAAAISPELLPPGSLGNRDVGFSRIHKLPHHRGERNSGWKERFECFSVQKNVSVQTEQNWAFLLI